MKNLRLMQILTLALMVTACAKKDDTEACMKSSTPNGKPAILVIGDSISIGYTPYVASAFPDYEIVHNFCNAQGSANGREKIDIWIAQRPKWEAITWNHGMWDVIKYFTPIETYKENLRAEGAKLLAVGVPVVFFTTTDAPGFFKRDDYNQAAIEVMAELSIPVADLGSVSEGIMALHVTPSDVHWNAEGSEVLADFVVQTLQSML